MTAPKRKKFWIDAPLQMRFVGFVTLLLAGGLLLGYLSMDRGLQEAARQARSIVIPVDWARETLRAPFLFSSAIILLAGVILALLFSHGIVGPLLVLTAGIRRVKEGNLKGEVRLRDTDALREVADDFAAMQASLRHRVAEDRERLAAVDRRLEAVAKKVAKDHGAAEELDAVRKELVKLTSFFHI